MSTVRGLILSDPQRHHDVRVLATARDARFGGVTVRPFALKGGLDLCPPGAAFVASIVACPDAFLDVVFVDPLLVGEQLSQLSRCLAPQAEVLGGDVIRMARQPDLDGWVFTRSEYITRLMGIASKADPWIATTALLDDLVLEAIDSHADRLFGQRRRRTLDTPGFSVPKGSAWSALAAEALSSSRPERLSLLSHINGHYPSTSAAPTSNSVTTALADGVRLGQQIVANLPASDGPVRINVLAHNDAPSFAIGLVNGLGTREMSARDTIVRVVDRFSARLGAFMLLYRELRFSCRGCVFFRWCPDPEALPFAELSISKVGNAWEINPSSVKT